NDPALDVPSPTFTLVQTYDLRLPVAHFDLYRIADPDELVELGLDEALQDGAVLIEWPERAHGRLPETTVSLRLEEENGGRQVHIDGPQDVIQRIARSLAIRRFLEQAGCMDATRRHYQGDASTRAYEAIETVGSDRRILMNAPRRLIGPIIKDGKRYAQIAHVAEDVRPFVAICHLLTHNGFHTPQIFAENLDAGFLLLEDLGSDGMVDAAGQPIVERWEAAVDCLVALHRTDIPETVVLSPGPPHFIPPFDRDAMMIEVDLLPSWYWPHVNGEAASSDFRTAFETCWHDLIDRLQTAEKGLVLRDFHSPNLLWQAGESGLRRLGFIDVQDAMRGPTTYDVASLVHDARVTIDTDLQDHLVKRYENARLEEPEFDPAAFHESLAIMQAQRNTKILGLFVRLWQRDGKSAYLPHLPRIEGYLHTALRHPVLQPLRDCYTLAGIVLTES
ncbi:MAG: tRNA (adenosine(37)-N6)-threonylcarbamoyltransferase complex ATPase subunit type 1 TsaE, partial [Pseudomonadota bacterium]